jgi:hypothetical protein
MRRPVSLVAFPLYTGQGNKKQKQNAKEKNWHTLDPATGTPTSRSASLNEMGTAHEHQKANANCTRQE